MNEQNIDIITQEQQEGLVLLERIKETEKAFKEAHDVLDNLDLPANRDRLSQAVNIFQNVQTNESNFEGCKLLKLEQQKLQEEYGVMFFPLTVSVPVSKWAEHYIDLPDGQQSQLSKAHLKVMTEGAEIRLTDGQGNIKKVYRFEDIKSGDNLSKTYSPDDESFECGGYFTATKPEKSEIYPFSITGVTLLSEQNLRMANIDAHEEMHRVFEIYNPLTRKYKNLEGKPDTIDSINFKFDYLSNGRIIDEINAYRTGISGGELSWDRAAELISSSCDDSVKQFNLDPNAINQSCDDVRYLGENLKLSESAITHILLNCQSLEDLHKWRQVDPTMIDQTYKNEEK